MFNGRRKLIVLIVAITVVPLAVLLFIGWRLLEQDRILEKQQQQQTLERAADLVVAGIERSISESEHRLMAGNTDWPIGVVTVSIHDDRLDAYPKRRLAYVPMAAPL